MAPSSSIAWKALEHCETLPFRTSDRSLKNVKFRLDRNDEPTPDEGRRIESGQDWDGLTPELFMDADAAGLSDDTGVPADDIVVSVICRDRILCKFERVATWPLRDVPEDSWSLSGFLDRFSRSTRFDVVVVATLRPDVPERSRLSIPAAASLATKRFNIRVLGRGLNVPIRFVEPAELVGQGLDRGSVCFVRWTGVDVTRPPGELLDGRLVAAVPVLRQSADGAPSAARGRGCGAPTGSAPDAHDGAGGNLPQAAHERCGAGPPDLPVLAARADDRPAESGVVLGHHLHSGVVRLPVPGCHHGLGQPSRAGVAVEERAA